MSAERAAEEGEKRGEKCDPERGVLGGNRNALPGRATSRKAVDVDRRTIAMRLEEPQSHGLLGGGARAVRGTPPRDSRANRPHAWNAHNCKGKRRFHSLNAYDTEASLVVT